jgi:hypothetical protein
MRHPLEQDDTSVYTPSDIIHIACFYLNLNPSSIIKKGRTKEYLLGRMLIYDLLLSNKTLQLTLERTGYLFGRHHSTLINARDELRKYLDVYDEIRHKLEHLHLSVYRHLDFYNHEISKRVKENKNFKKILIDIPEQLFYDMLVESKKTDITFSELVTKCIKKNLQSISNNL